MWRAHSAHGTTLGIPSKCMVPRPNSRRTLAATGYRSSKCDVNPALRGTIPILYAVPLRRRSTPPILHDASLPTEDTLDVTKDQLGMQCQRPKARCAPSRWRSFEARPWQDCTYALNKICRISAQHNQRASLRRTRAAARRRASPACWASGRNKQKSSTAGNDRRVPCVR